MTGQQFDEQMSALVEATRQLCDGLAQLRDLLVELRDLVGTSLDVRDVDSQGVGDAVRHGLAAGSRRLPLIHPLEPVDPLLRDHGGEINVPVHRPTVPPNADHHQP